MAFFTDSEEVYRYVGGIFEEALRDPELGPRFAASGVVLKLRFTEPDTVLVVDMVSGKVERGDGAEKPTVEIATSADVGHRFWLGKVNIAVALARGEMRAKGPINKIIKLVPLAKQVFPRYRDLLLRAGRTDLAAV